MTRIAGLGGPGGIGGTARGGKARPASESFSLAAPAQQETPALGALAALQRAVLGGTAPDLDALARSAAEIELPADPALRAIVGAIRLRARVELARHGRL